MRISIGNVKLAFDVQGSALDNSGDVTVERKTVVVLRAGAGFNPADFEAFSKSAQLVFLDQRGQGRSDPGETKDWHLDQWADDVAAFCRALEIEKPILLGHAYGGVIALAAAVRHPELASGLVLLSSAAHVEREGVIARFGELGGPDAARAMRGMTERPEDEAALAEYGRHGIPLYARKNPAAFAAKMGRFPERPEQRTHFFKPDGEFGRFDYRAGLRRCRIPTLMLNGKLDPLFPIADAEETAACFPAGVAELITFEDGAYDLVGDCWPDVQAAVTSFIRKPS